MPRKPDGEIKPALLERILEHLLDKTLSTLSFRTLATALGVSTYTLVYHFGTRAQLVREIISAIATRQRGFEPQDGADDEFTIDDYFTALRRTFELSLLPRNRALQRLEFEAQMIEALETEHQVTRSVHQDLQDSGRDALIALGLSDDDAAIESRLLVDTFYGIQVGLAVNGDDARATAAFERALSQHHAQIRGLIDRVR